MSDERTVERESATQGLRHNQDGSMYWVCRLCGEGADAKPGQVAPIVHYGFCAELRAELARERERAEKAVAELAALREWRRAALQARNELVSILPEGQKWEEWSSVANTIRWIGKLEASEQPITRPEAKRRERSRDE